MNTEHKDIKIDYNEDHGEWRVATGPSYNQYKSFPQLKAAKAYIDTQQKVKFVPVECWVTEFDGWGGGSNFKNITQVTATRPHTAGEFWIKKEKKRKAKNKSYIYLDNPENRRKFPLITDLEQLIESKRKEKESLVESLETIEEMRKVE